MELSLCSVALMQTLNNINTHVHKEIVAIEMAQPPPTRRPLNYDYFLAEIKTLFQLAQDSRPVMPNKAHTRPIF
jgi:hypothetical protein